jgi:hypothetical protein
MEVMWKWKMGMEKEGFKLERLLLSFRLNVYELK